MERGIDLGSLTNQALTRRDLLKHLALTAGGAIALTSGLIPIDALASTLAASGATWRHLRPLHSPNARAFSAMAFDPGASSVVLFGGLGAGNETWLFEGAEWRQSSALGPAARHGASLAFDPASGSVLLFGGLTRSGFAADTWTWRGEEWRRLDLAVSPSARLGAAMAVDPVSNRLVLFGGLADGSVAADTWTWSGSAWTQLTSSSPLPSRTGALLGVDPSSARLVLAGGQSSPMGVPPVTDAWQWTGSAWTRATSSVQARPTFAASAGTGSGDALAAFGGLQNGAPSDDGWVDKRGSIHGTARPGPSPRAYASMAYEPNSGGLLLFGGHGASGFLADTWLLSV